MVKLVDTPDLGSGAVRCVGSSPILGIRRTNSCKILSGFFYFMTLYFFCRLVREGSIGWFDNYFIENAHIAEKMVPNIFCLISLEAFM